MRLDDLGMTLAAGGLLSLLSEPGYPHHVCLHGRASGNRVKRSVRARVNFLCTRQGLQSLPEDTVETPIIIAECLMPQIWKMAEMNSILTSVLFLHTVFTMNTSREIFGKDMVGGRSATSLFTEHLMGDGVGGLAGRGAGEPLPLPLQGQTWITC